MTGAGIHIDMWVDAALADQFEIGKTGQKGVGHWGPLAKKDKHLGLRKTFVQDGGVFGVIGPYGYIMHVQAGERWQGSQSVEPVVKNMNPHQSAPK